MTECFMGKGGFMGKGDLPGPLHPGSHKPYMDRSLFGCLAGHYNAIGTEGGGIYHGDGGGKYHMVYTMGGGMYHGDGGGLYGAAPPQQQQQPTLEITYVYIPETTVGAVIGTKGTNIKNIMRLSGARIKGDQKRERGPRHEEQRKVIVTGTPEAQWKACICS
ncbi:hypothetical protein DPMN_062234 [Dreissena polymorpha]|uniref:K Homology domain-containing protein n=1 Tax=Dreissena polymorpha TaxID=45954 RepID=A0A9D4HHY5_DREPO|nr:hypothetical protein DPMN_062234 [Dreissena polymorpha]